MNKLSRRIRGLFASRKQRKHRSYRRLRTEPLEGRMLLAADFIYSLSTNPFDREDVNGDHQVSPIDVLAVINALNDSGNVVHSEGNTKLVGMTKFDVDVNGDEALSPLDALLVINELNAEGEHGGTHQVAYTPITLATTFTRGSRNLFFDYVDNGSTDQIVRSAGSWITDGFSAGNTILISDSGQFVDINVGLVIGKDETGADIIGTADADIHVQNNGLYTIQSVTANTVTLDRNLITQFPARSRLDGDLVEGQTVFDNTASFFRVINSVAPGGDFLLGTLVEDLRTVDGSGNPLPDVAKGPFAAYVDVMFDSALAAPTGTGITDISFFNGLTSQNFTGFSTPGLVDDTGGVAFTNPGFAPTGAGKQLVWTTRFRAGNAGGTVTFGQNAADGQGRETLMFGNSNFIPVAEILFNSASITIATDISAVNDGPIAVDEGSTNNNINVLANDTVTNPAGANPTITQVNGQAVTVNQNIALSNGSLTFLGSSKTGANFRYTPAAGNSASTSFTYTISNGQTPAATATATVSITINPVDDRPVIAGPTSRSTNEDTALTLGQPTPGFTITDPDSTNISVTLSLSPNNGTLSQTTFSGTPAQVTTALNAVTYTPLLNSNAPVTLNISASDGGPAPGTKSVSITINPVNDPPVNTVPGPQVAFNTETLAFTPGQFSVADVDNATLQVTLAITNQATSQPSSGTLSVGTTTGLTVTGNNSASVSLSGTIAALNAGLGSLIYDPLNTFIGTDTLTMTTSDGTLSDTDTVTITVTPPTIPFAAADSYTANEGTASFVLSPNPLNNDVKAAGNTLSVTGVNPVNAQGSLAFANGNFTYTPPTNPDFFGTETFTYTIESSPDAGDGPSTGTISVNILPVNDGPINTVPGPRTVNEDTTLSFTGANAISIRDIDAGTGSLSVTLTATRGNINVTGGTGVTNNGTKSVGLSGTVSQINTTLGGLTYSPDLNFSGSDVLTITTNDNGNTGSGGALSDTDTVNITISPINDPPTIVVPGKQSFFTDFDNTFSSTPNRFQISDVDAGNSNVQVDLTIGVGTLRLGNAAGVTVTPNPGGNNGLRITGSVANINTALSSGVIYNTSTDGNRSLSATVNDLGNTGGGGQQSASATVDVEVLDFVPIDIIGKVFIDHNSDGNRSSNEPEIGGVSVTLSGTDFQGNSVNLTAITDAHGNYTFNALRPTGSGPYTITREQPAFIRPGGASNSASLTLDVRGNVSVTGGSLNFGVGGFTPEYADVWDLFALSDVAPNNSGILFGMQGTQKWSIFAGTGWDASRYSNPRFTPGTDANSGVLTVFDATAGVDRTVNVSTQAGTLTYRGNGVNRVYRVIGGSSLLGALSNGANPEGESQSNSTSGNATTNGAAYARGVDSLFASGGL